MLAVLVALLLTPGPAAALGWGGIEPAVTTLPQVRERWGAPNRETRAREEGHDTIQWVYEGQAAPGGMFRMVVDFGLLQPDGYKPQLVRALRLEPKPLIFGRQTTAEAFGAPDRVGTLDGVEVLVYTSGLVVYFDKEGTSVAVLLFTPPLPDLGGAAPPGGSGPSGGAGAGGSAPAPR
ncbi:MAG TPA: hypothetical protein VMT79_16635 [Candidatus Binatia bacterium]|nr:hypothetical protein [Candidatus Binatia bacterium]